MTKKEITQLSYEIIGYAIKVHKKLGPGLLEKIYEECLKYELEKNGYNVKFCSIGCRNKDEEWKLNSSINANMVQQNKKGPNKLEIAGRRILETLRKDFDLKFTIKEQKLLCKKFLVDIFIPSKNLIIQWDGDYWHGNTTKFKKLNKIDKI